MRTRIFLIFVSICLICGCGHADKKPPAAIKIGDINITADEYRDAFKNSPYFSIGTPESKKEFLDNFIARMLILREADRTGMDKNPEFLKSVQLFWQQSLIKMMVDRKIKEISVHIRINESEIKDYYQANKDTEFKGQEMPAVYDQIKWVLFNKKQKALLDEWLDSLRARSKVSVNNKLLKTDE